MKQPACVNLNLYRGDSYSWKLTIWGNPEHTEVVDLTGATAAAQWRERIDAPTAVTFDCTITEPNIVTVSLTPPMWVGAPTRGVWDLQITEADGTVSTLLTGKIAVTADVTNSTPEEPVLLARGERRSLPPREGSDPEIMLEQELDELGAFLP